MLVGDVGVVSAVAAFLKYYQYLYSIYYIAYTIPGIAFHLPSTRTAASCTIAWDRAPSICRTQSIVSNLCKRS